MYTAGGLKNDRKDAHALERPVRSALACDRGNVLQLEAVHKADVVDLVVIGAVEARKELLGGCIIFFVDKELMIHLQPQLRSS